MPDGTHVVTSRAVRAYRIGWTIATLVVVETVVCGLATAPAILFWRWLLTLPLNPTLRLAVICVAIAPTYVAFAVLLMVVSPIAVRLLRWQPLPDAHMRIADLEWPLLGWVRYGATIHLVRIVAGTLLRGTPLWTSHLRLAGARLGRRVYVNSLSVSDYNLIECGDDVVIGGAVHMSGHTVEDGVVKTARVRIGNNVTVGLGSVIEIGVEIGSDSQIGALSFVPKHSKLAGGHVYTGAPAVPIR